MTNKIFSSLKILTLAIVLSFGLSYVYAWTAPTQSPPAGNVSAPINTSATAQTKAGGLTIDSATSTKDIVVNGVTVGKGGTNLISNTVIGSYVLASSTSGDRNTVVGYQAIQFNVGGTSNTAIGTQALRSGEYTTFYGPSNGMYNTAIGDSALISNRTAHGNTAVGWLSLLSNSVGMWNTAVGTQALVGNTTGSNNTAIGDHAGNGINTGSNNTALGASSGQGLCASPPCNNTTAVGSGARTTASNEIQLGNTAVTAVRTSGTVYAPDVCTTAGTCLSSAGGVSLGPVYTKTCSYDNQCQCSDNSIMVGMTSGWIMSGESAIYTGSYTIKCRNILN